MSVLVALGGSLRENSISLAGLRALTELAQAQGIRSHLLDLRDLDLPIFVPDKPIEAYASADQAHIRQLVETFRLGTMFVWSSPTYHGTISGAFKNALDYLELIRDDARPYLQGSPVGLMVASESRTFEAMMQSAYALRAWLAPTQIVLESEHFNAQGQVTSERLKRRLQRLVHELAEFSNQRIRA